MSGLTDIDDGAVQLNDGSYSIKQEDIDREHLKYSIWNILDKVIPIVFLLLVVIVGSFFLSNLFAHPK